MRVIDGGFGKKDADDEDELPIGQSLKKQMEESGIYDRDEGSFVVMYLGANDMLLLTNHEGPGDVLLDFEITKTALMTEVFGGQ